MLLPAELSEKPCFNLFLNDFSIVISILLFRDREKMRDDWDIKSNMLITIVPSYLAFKNAIALCLMSFFFFRCTCLGWRDEVLICSPG